MSESKLPWMKPCEHAEPQSASQLHGVCIFCYRDRLSEAHRQLATISDMHACGMCGKPIESNVYVRLNDKYVHRTCHVAGIRAEHDQARAALSNVSGALVDSGVVVPDDETKYGEAVREIVRERDEARAGAQFDRDEHARTLAAYERHKEQCTDAIAQRDGRIAEFEALAKMVEASLYFNLDKKKGMVAAWFNSDVDYSELRRLLDAALSTPAQPATPLMAELNDACRAVDSWPQRDKDLRDLSIRAEEHFAQPKTPKEHCPRRLMGETLAPHAPCDTGDHSKDAQPAPHLHCRCIGGGDSGHWAGDSGCTRAQPATAAKEEDERIYPCADCGVMRNKAEGGTTFTICDECWDRKNDPDAAPPSPAAREAWPDNCQHTRGYAEAGHRCPCDHDCGCRQLTCRTVISSNRDVVREALEEIHTSVALVLSSDRLIHLTDQHQRELQSIPVRIHDALAALAVEQSKP